MNRLRVTSLPVQSKEDGDFVGFVDTLDFVTHILKYYMRNESLEGASQGWTDWLTEDEEARLAGRALRFSFTPLSKVQISQW